MSDTACIARGHFDQNILTVVSALADQHQRTCIYSAYKASQPEIDLRDSQID